MLQKNLFSMFKKVAGEIAREAQKAKARAEASRKKAPAPAPKRPTSRSTVGTSQVNRHQVATGKRPMPKIAPPVTTEQKQRVKRLERSVMKTQERTEKFDGYMNRIGKGERNLTTDRHNQKRIELFIEDYEKQRDAIEEDLERRKLELESNFNKRIERLAERYHGRLQRMIDMANTGRRIA